MPSQPSERAAVVGKIDPQSANNTTKATDAVDLSKFAEVMFVLLIGSVDSTVDFKLQESADASAWSDITGRAITPFTATDDNKCAVINLKAEKLSSGKRYARGLATLGNGTAQLLAAVALGLTPRLGPATDDKLAACAQVV